MESGEPIIRLRNVGKEFKTANGPVVALEDINLDIARGGGFRHYRPVRRREKHFGPVYQHAGDAYRRGGDI